MCIFSAFVLDPLHAIEQGEHGKHLWVWLLEALPETSLSEIDSWCENSIMTHHRCLLIHSSSFKNCPRFPGIHHFKNGVTGLKYITGAEHGQILRVG
jgi:hypothetical protein